MAQVIPSTTRSKASISLLEMAKKWEKVGKVQHAIESYEAVIEAEPQSKEAAQAQEALMEIAQRFNEKGKEHSAYHLYHKLAEGRAGSHNRI